MANKNYNPNTKYGRKKLREQYYENRANMTEEEKGKEDGCTFILFIIIIIVFGGFILLVSGPEALIKWLSH